MPLPFSGSASGCAPPDGLAVARHVHAHAGDRHVAVLLMAGQHDAVDDAEMAAAGVRGVLRKPLDSLQLIEAVRGAMRGSRGQAPWAPPVLPEPVETPAAGVPETPDAAAVAAAFSEETPVITMDDPTMPHPLRDEDLERVAARVAAIWSGDEDREQLPECNVFIRLLGDFVLDCHGNPVDANHVAGLLPSGNGSAGGTFESWFRLKREHYRRPADRPRSDRTNY